MLRCMCIKCFSIPWPTAGGGGGFANFDAAFHSQPPGPESKAVGKGPVCVTVLQHTHSFVSMPSPPERANFTPSLCLLVQRRPGYWASIHMQYLQVYVTPTVHACVCVCVLCINHFTV